MYDLPLSLCLVVLWLKVLVSQLPVCWEVWELVYKNKKSLCLYFFQVGVAVAFAASALLQNLFGACAVVLEEMFHIGDWVRVGDVEGSVEHIGVFY